MKIRRGRNIICLLPGLRGVRAESGLPFRIRVTHSIGFREGSGVRV